MRRQPTFIVLPPPKPRPIGDYFKSIGKSVLTNALIYGLSAAVPPLGAVAIPAYMTYNYSKLGYNLYKVYDEMQSKGKVSLSSVTRASGSLGEFVTQRPADDTAATIVAKVQESGLFQEMAKKTNVDEVVFAEMFKGSISSGLSASGGELAKFVIRKAVGA